MKKIFQILFWPVVFIVLFFYFNRIPIIDLKNSTAPILIKGILKKAPGAEMGIGITSEYAIGNNYYQWWYIELEKPIRFTNSVESYCDGEYNEISLGVDGYAALDNLRGKKIEISGFIGCHNQLNSFEKIDFSKNDGPFLKAEIDRYTKNENIRRALEAAAIKLGFADHNDKVEFEKSGVNSIEKWKSIKIQQHYWNSIPKNTYLENVLILGLSTYNQLRDFMDNGGLNTDPMWRGNFVSFIKTKYNSNDKIEFFEMNFLSDTRHKGNKTKSVTVNSLKSDLARECGSPANWRPYHPGSDTDIAESDIARCEITRQRDGDLRLFVLMKDAKKIN